ncbi:hypothetical protein [Kamptonema sp. UHCC 0994]|uniref:hypothetical protein n=1 Tax=Kamptonema sp. UHCC 0994 TaxID=3031329 RepID=UPI0023BA03BD|nr:hypothetical protein [Kamptonema sp. UHCC 0994]MDF0553119.1 hypothetical protein [Kamptonema sp. UHCC 0994]
METELEIVNCATCPFARHLDGNRYICTDSATANDVVRGHWEVGTDCYEKIEAMTLSANAVIEEIDSLKEEQMKVLEELDKLFAAIEFEKNRHRAWLEPNNPDNWLLAEIEEYKANLSNPEWLRDWYLNPDNFLYEGDELVGCEDPEPLESKYPFLRADYDSNFDEL